MRLSESSWLRVGCDGRDAEEVQEPKGEALIPYPDEGWHDPPIEVMRLFRAVLTGIGVGRRLEKQESDRNTITVSLPKKQKEAAGAPVRKSTGKGHAQQKSA